VTQPLLELPITGGRALMCTQSNGTPSGIPGNSHSAGNCLYALDLVCPTDRHPLIHAAHAGRVSYAFGDADDSFLAGDGWGNSVRLDHADGFFTLYAHLAEVNVHLGETVACGALLGAMGDTGNTGYRHLHFSFHAGSGKDWDGTGALPMERLRCWTEPSGETELSSQEFAWSCHVEWPNRNIYVSLNGLATQNLDARALRRSVQRLKRHCWMRPWRWLQFRSARRRFGERKP
jgi:murein DD-endopeptidase MepM/ murein hydrolase activator NlpD